MRLPDPCNRSLREGSDFLKAQLGHHAMHRSGKASKGSARGKPETLRKFL
jgi:hypothetical protein